MRIFYVALTRASQKLILTGVSEKEAILKWQNQVLLNENSEIYDGKKNKHIFRLSRQTLQNHNVLHEIRQDLSLYLPDSSLTFF